MEQGDIPLPSEQIGSQCPNVKDRDCSPFFASPPAKLKEEIVWRGIETTNVIK